MDYSKHKDRDPKDTVEFIKGILADIGIETELRWTSHTPGGICSNRVTIKGTKIGTNGKGTSEDYATASGYAEFMERLQQGILFGNVGSGADVYARNGFSCAPDERYSTVEEVFARREPVLAEWLSNLGINSEAAQLDMLRRLADLSFSRGDGMLCEIPLVELTEGRVVWLPAALVRMACGSNGMAAGNSYEECLVQGLSEVFERYVTAQIVSGKAVPPQVPDSWLEEAGLADVIEEVRGGGRYEVRVYDGSLGRGYPVMMSSIVDRYRSTFGVKLGAHPSFAIAVERTLTEAFQGRDVEQASSTNHLADNETAGSGENIKWLFVNNVGAYPATAFIEEAGWTWEAWPSWDGASNRDMLCHMVGLLKKEGRRILVRDSSHLGFCSCMVVVPGMSDIPQGQFLANVYETVHPAQAFSHFPSLTREEQDRLLAIEPANLLSSHPAAIKRPFTGHLMVPGRIFGFLHLAREEFDEAARCFEALENSARSVGRIYWRAMVLYARQRAGGLDLDAALKVVRLLHIPAVANRVDKEARAAAEDLRHIFYQMNCYNCDHCELREAGGCLGIDAAVHAQSLVAHVIARSSVSQQALLERLDYLVGTV